MRKFLEKLGRYKFLELLKIISGRLLKTYCYKMHYLVLDINIDEIQKKLIDFDLPVKVLEYEDFLLGDPAVFTVHKLKGVARRLNDGSHKAYGIIENDKLIYSTWISFKELSLPVDIKYTLPSNEGLLEDSYCNKEARGRGLHFKMNLFRICKLHELGKNRVIVIVLSGNTPAFKVQLKSGFREIGTFHCGRILGKPFSTLKHSRYEGK